MNLSAKCANMKIGSQYIRHKIHKLGIKCKLALFNLIKFLFSTIKIIDLLFIKGNGINSIKNNILNFLGLFGILIK